VGLITWEVPSQVRPQRGRGRGREVRYRGLTGGVRKTERERERTCARGKKWRR
jgi:hypothetical protein